jgi:hypothetical protein
MIMDNIAPGAQATLDQLGQELLDAIYTEHRNSNPMAKDIMRRYQRQEISSEQYVAEIQELFADDKGGMVTFLMNGITDSSRRDNAREKYLLARSMVESSQS